MQRTPSADPKPIALSTSQLRDVQPRLRDWRQAPETPTQSVGQSPAASLPAPGGGTFVHHLGHL